MFIYNFCTDLGDNLFDEKISVNKKEEYITRYKLENKGNVKEYWINNVYIVNNNDKFTFKYIRDLSVEYINNMLIQEVDISECIPFNFYTVDNEYQYELFENTIDGIIYQVKNYGDFITYSYISETKVIVQ